VLGDPEGARILVVDDEPNIVKTLVLILRNFGYQAEGVDTARAAREHVQDRSPQVLLIDMHLPDGDGVELAEYLTRKVPGAHAFILTGDLGAIDQETRFEMLAKPVHPEVLLSRIRQAMATPASPVPKAA
jgi:two-component system response regulator GlrR